MISDPQIEFWDCRKGLPFRDGAVTTIFTEHFLEHLAYADEVQEFLRECHRCLSPSGVLRVIVPDAGVYLSLYCEGTWDKFAARRPLIKEGDGYRDYWLDERYFTKMEFINAVFRQSGEHKYAYDAETLINLLRRVGFESVRQTSFGISLAADMAPDTPERRAESLYVEAVK
jgi:predicted SAM-dependent methyltransferase